METEVKKDVLPASAELEGVKSETGEANANPIAPVEKKIEPVDYKVELERIKRERDNYKTGMLNAKARLKAKPDNPDEPLFNESDLEQTINDKIDEKIASRSRDLVDDVIESQLDELATDPNERELIKFHYENTLRSSGYSRSAIVADLRRAKIIANESVILNENNALKEIIKSKKTMSNTGTGSNQDKPSIEPEQVFTPQELAILKRRGIDPKTVRK